MFLNDLIICRDFSCYKRKIRIFQNSVKYLLFTKIARFKREQNLEEINKSEVRFANETNA